MAKDFWVTNSRFKYIGIILLIIWVGFMVFFFLKADEITKDPCAICSEKMGQEVVCTLTDTIPVTRTYYPNGTVYTDTPQVKRMELPIDSKVTDFIKNHTVEE